MKWLGTIAAFVALATAGCVPCRQGSDCGDGQVCSAGSCQAIAACSAGQTAPCVCGNGGQGSQVCGANGAGFGACACDDSCGPAGCAVMPDLVNKEVSEAGQLLKDASLKLPDPSDPTAYIVERRFNDPPSVVLEQFPAAGGKLPRGTAPLLRVVMPPDQETLGLPNSAFLVGQLAQHDEIAAQAYYDAIDPGPVPSRGTLKDWKIANGFGDPTQGIAPQPADDEAAAIYSNRADLGFGRHMHMRRKGDHIAFYVDNYPTVDDTVNNTRMFATVAMEWTRPAGNPSGRPFTKFFTFNKKGERIYDPALDSHGIKLQPGVCLACHGGTISDAQFSNGGDLSARFIPFDLDSLGFSTRPGYTRADQELQFKKLNVAVKMTYPADDPAYPPSDPAPVPELVNGWYGGPGMPSPFFDGKFVPAGWADDQTSWDLYLDVFAKTCRGCHMQREPGRNFSTYDKFWGKKGLIYQRVFEDGAMPLSEKGNLNFWLSSPSEPEILAAWLGKPFQAPGRPVARVRIANVGNIRPNDTVRLDAVESQYAQKLTWTQTSGPAVVLSTNGSSASFVAPATVATIDISVVAGFESQSSSAAIAHIVTVDPPGKPTNTGATPSVNSVNVSWTAPAFTGNAAISKYRVTASDGTFVETADGTTTNATVSGLNAGQAYTFTVKATNAAGLTGLSSNPSPAATPTAPPAGTVNNLSLVAGAAQITVRWNAPSSGTIDTYKIRVFRGFTQVGGDIIHSASNCVFGNPACQRTVTNLTTCAFGSPSANCSQQYAFFVSAHDTLSAAGVYGPELSASGRPLVSFQSDNLGAIFTAHGCGGCHTGSAAPFHKFTTAFPGNYNAAVAPATPSLIHDCPLNGTGCAGMGGGFWTAASAEYVTLQRWVNDGRLQ